MDSAECNKYMQFVAKSAVNDYLLLLMMIQLPNGIDQRCYYYIQ